MVKASKTKRKLYETGWKKKLTIDPISATKKKKSRALILHLAAAQHSHIPPMSSWFQYWRQCVEKEIINTISAEK